MTCFTKYGNCCYPNTPRPIRVIGECQNDSIEIVRQALESSFGFFENLTQSVVNSGSIIPLTLSNSRGTRIKTNGAGGAELSAGTYEVTYFVNVTVPVSGNITVGLEQNGVTLANSLTTINQTGSISISKTIVISIPQTSTLNLKNFGLQATFISANLFIKEI